jgi:hypothetical protein
MAPRVVHRTLDGKRIQLSGELDLSRPATSVATIALDGRLHEITSGERGAAHAWADDLGVTRFDDEFAVQGGRLRIGHSTLRDAHAGLQERVLAAVWEGRRYAVFTHLYHARAADAVGFFNALTLSEHADGAAFTPRRRAALTEPTELVKEVPGLGLLEVTTLTKQTARRLPSWSGARVASGELFKDTLEDKGTFFLLATASALVTVLPTDESRVHEVPRRLAGLTAEILH